MVCVLVFRVIKADRLDLLLVVTVLAYVLLRSLFGYYDDRFGLPLYPVVAWLRGQFPFLDLPPLFNRRPDASMGNGRKARPALTIILVLGCCGYITERTVANLKTYNLLQTRSPWDRTLEYRQTHNLMDGRGIHNIARQIFTPKIRGNNIKVTKGFRFKFAERDRTKPIDLLQLHWPSYRNFVMAAHEQEEPGLLALKEYREFYLSADHDPRSSPRLILR